MYPSVAFAGTRGNEIERGWCLFDVVEVIVASAFIFDDAIFSRTNKTCPISNDRRLLL